jgi:hypothetical protein
MLQSFIRSQVHWMLSCSITQHLSTVEEEASAGEKLNLGFPRHARSSRDVHRITGRKQI